MTSIGQHLNILSMLLMGWSNKILSLVIKLSVMTLSSNEFSPSLHKSESRRGTPEDWEGCGEIQLEWEDPGDDLRSALMFNIYHS